MFLCDSTGKHISAIGLIGADKWNPLQIKNLPKGFTLQEDNVALEYGIPPAATADEFVQHIARVMEASRKWTKGLSFSKLSCVVFPEDQMEHPNAHIFGCEPDYDAWTKKTNRKPQPPNPFMRSAGGHIHVETTQDPHLVGKYMDLFLSVPAVLMDEKGQERKKMYGKKGSIRVKPYGVEYRPLSNFWIFEEKYIRWAWWETARALSSDIEIDKLENAIDIAVNQNDKQMAEALVKEYSLSVI